MDNNIPTFAENLAHFTHGMALMVFVIFSIELFLMKNKNTLLKHLFWVMLFWVFVELKDLIYLVPGLWDDDAFGTLNLSIDTLSAPVILLFMFEILSPRWVNRRRAVILFSPFVLLIALYAVTSNTIFFKILVLLSFISGIIAFFVIFRASKKYDKYLKENYSNIEHLTVQWLRYLIFMVFLSYIIWAVTAIWEQTWIGDVIFYLFFITLWVIFYFYSRRHILVEMPDVLSFKTIITDEEILLPEQNDNKNPNGSFAFAEKLALLMETDRLYLSPTLTIIELANAVGTNRTYLSDYLNKQLGSNFYEYVNAFRVKKACSMLISGNIENLETIAEACGFNSLSTFRRAFVEVTGQTPLQYRKSKFS
jgi:AraC-like DNA-binding protein